MSHDPVAGFPAPLGAPPRFEREYQAQRESSRPPEPRKPRVWLHLVLFGLTALSMQVTAMSSNLPPQGHSLLGYSAYQAMSLIGILLVHELGHYIAARLHRVPASPPYFSARWARSLR
jgi:hypothetical protein